MSITTMLSKLGTANIDDLYALTIERSSEYITIAEYIGSPSRWEEKLLAQFLDAVSRVFIRLRKAKGYATYEKFAFAHSFPRAQYWRVESGKHNLTLRTLMKLLIIHRLTLPEFVVMIFAEIQRGDKSKESPRSIEI